MTRLWLIRHGPTHAKGMIGWTDLPADLSDTAALNRLAARLPDAAPRISSDLSRAVATADRLGGARLGHDPDLREIHFGDWETLTAAEASASDPHLARAFWEDPGHHAPPGGESWDAFSSRTARAIDRLRDAHPQGDLVIVAHFGVICAALARAAGMPARAAFAFRIDPLSLTRIDALPGGHWAVQGVNHAP